MKLKPIFITSGVLLVLGVACAIVGAALNGGTIKNIEQETFVDRSRTFENCREMTISDYDTDVEIISTNGEMRVDYTESEKSRYEITETDGRVGIKKKADLRFFDFSVVTDKRKLILYVPESYDGVLDISTSNSELTAEGISAGETKLDNSNGSITLTGCSLGDFDVSLSNGRCDVISCGGSGAVIGNSNGDIVIEELTTSGKLTVDSSNGTIKLDGITAKELRAEMSNGQITAGTISVLGKAELENSNGRITIGSITAEELEAENSNGGIKLDYADCLRIKLGTSNADVTGTLAGTIASYSVRSEATNGKSSLPDEMKGGDRTLEVEVSNGNIALDFDGADFCF